MEANQACEKGLHIEQDATSMDFIEIRYAKTGRKDSLIADTLGKGKTCFLS